MAYDTGYTSFFKLANEASWGNADAPDDDCLLLEATGNIEEDQGVEQNFGTGSRLNNQNTYGNYAASGSITGKIQGGRMIAYGLGADSGSVATGLYTHTMTPLDTTDIPTVNIGKYHINTDKGREMSGTRVNDFSLNLDVGDPHGFRGIERQHHDSPHTSRTFCVTVPMGFLVRLCG